MYKSFYSKQHDVPLDRIDVEYFIVKENYTKVWISSKKSSDIFNGKPSINKVINRLQHFMDECYNDDGTFKDVNYEKCRTKKDCRRFTKCKDLP